SPSGWSPRPESEPKNEEPGPPIAYQRGMTEASYMKALFHGVIAEDSLLPYPAISHREADDVQTLLAETRRLAEKEIDARAIDESACIPEGVVLGLKKIGLFGASIPKEHGGMGLTTTATARI